MKPTALEAAAAIQAACNETGENPIDIVSGKIGGRARHYAMHALIKVFPEIPRKDAATFVFCPGKPGMFFGNSWSQVAKPVSGSINGRRQANWWDEEAFERVCDAVRRTLLARPETVEEPEGDGGDFLETRIDAAPVEERRGLRMSPLQNWQPPIKLSAVDDRRVIEPVRPSAGTGKREARDMLAQAVRNTAAIPIRDDAESVLAGAENRAKRAK